MRPYEEKLAIPNGQSCALRDRRLDDGIPFHWHYHPEFELTLTLNSRGQRFVGDSIASYDDGDLVLLGPDLPHTWAFAGKLTETEPHVAVVFWFRSEWIETMIANAAELSTLKPMLADASRGVFFSARAAAAARPDIAELIGLDPARRLVGLLRVLVALSRDSEAICLAGAPWRSQRTAQPDRSRFERVLDHIHAHYQSRITLQDLADVAHLSPSGLNRLFHRQAQMPASDYVAQLRVGRACQLLMTTSRPIARIAADCGYENLSHFNRQFRALKRSTPRDFRNNCVAAIQENSRGAAARRQNRRRDGAAARP